MINFTTPTKTETEYNSAEQLKVREQGLSSPDSGGPPVDLKDRNQLPAGGGRFPIAPHLSTVGLINQAIRAYHYAFDPAQKKSRQDAVACRNDPIIAQAIREANVAVSELAWAIEPADETDPKQVEAAEKVTQAFSKTPCLQQVLNDLLEALWFGRAGVQFTYQWDSVDPTLLTVKDWSPIQGDSLVARWANQDWGVLVNYDYDGETEPYNLGQAHFFTPSELEAVVIHQSERDPPDWFDIVGAGSIRGTGWRKYVFWYWYIKANIFAILLDLLERLGSGIWVAGYDQSNPSGRNDFENAIAAYKAKRVLSIPQDKEGRSAYSLKILEPGSTSFSIIENMIRYLDGAIRAIILGHPLGSGADIAVGGDPTALYGDSIGRTTKYHANNLAETISAKWLPVYYKYMCPNVPVGKFKFLTDHPNADKLIQYAVALKGMGWAVDLNHLASICGLPLAAPSSTIGTDVQSLNPMPLQQGQPPINIPVATNEAPQGDTNGISG